MLSRRGAVFVVLHYNPHMEQIVIDPACKITVNVELFTTKKTLVFSAEEFELHRAAYVLLQLDDPKHWQAWVDENFWPSSLALTSPFSI